MQPTSIKQWPKSEQPREKMLCHGPQTLSDAELLAVLLRSGSKGQDAIQLARAILAHCGGFRGLFSSGTGELMKLNGLGLAKAASLIAVSEIAVRHLREQIIGKNYAHDPQSVLEFLYASLRDRKKELFKVLFLDKGNRIIDETNLFEGTVDQTVVHTREVVEAALARHATALILVHNHPSGRVQPSQEDRILTGRLQGACSPLGIRILDHVIIGDNQYFSFSEQRLL